MYANRKLQTIGNLSGLVAKGIISSRLWYSTSIFHGLFIKRICNDREKMNI